AADTTQRPRGRPTRGNARRVHPSARLCGSGARERTLSGAGPKEAASRGAPHGGDPFRRAHMKTYRSVTAAAIIGAAGAIGALSIGSALGQPATQPDQRPGQPTTQPGQPGQPGQRPTMTPGQQRGTTANERLFALEGAGAERQIQQLAQRLNQIEQQMQRTNQQLSQQVSRLDTMQGEEKINAIG